MCNHRKTNEEKEEVVFVFVVICSLFPKIFYLKLLFDTNGFV